MRNRLISLICPALFSLNSLAQTETSGETPPRLVAEGFYPSLIEPMLEKDEPVSGKNFVEAILEYPDKEVNEKYNHGFFNTYHKKLDEEFYSEREHPQYYLLREYKEGKVPYSGLFVSAFGRTLVAECDSVKELDELVRKARDSVTIKKDFGESNFIFGPDLRSVEDSGDAGLKLDFRCQSTKIYLRKNLKGNWRLGLSSKDNGGVNLEARGAEGETIFATYYSYTW